MGISRDDAYRILELPRGATPDEIRASYKRLALKWHPDKHTNSPDSTKRFQEVSSAYKRLSSDDSDDEVLLSTADMFDLFAHIFFHRNGMHSCCHQHAFESDDENFYSDEDPEDMEDELLHNIASRLRSKYDRSKSAGNTKATAQTTHNLSEAEALKNAEELINEEEQDRKKAEKRRQKKKRNKEKRKQKEKDKKDQTDQTDKENKQDNKKSNTTESKNLYWADAQNMSNKPTQNGNFKESFTLKENISPGITQSSTMEKTNISNRNKLLNAATVTSTDEPDWDTSSAFFAHAAGRGPPSNPSTVTPVSTNASKVNLSSTAASSPITVNTYSNKFMSQVTTEDVDPLVVQSRQIAVRGNEMANTGNFQAAIELFTQAVKLDARDFRFFGNRSYCFDRLRQYEKALQDADVAISLAPDWPKGYFRRGRALAGLKLFADAENAFVQVLKLDKHCQDAMFELARVRVQQLEEMGFQTGQSEVAIHACGTVQAALEALLAGKVDCPTSEEIYVSDGEEDHKAAQSLKRPIPNSQCSNDCKSVWVGNVNGEVKESQFQQLFSKCGRIESIKILPKKYCAFINYYSAESASKAIEKLQGYEMAGQKFLLRFPTKNPLAPVPPVPKPSSDASYERSRLTGPVNGDECYFWRTTGCAFNDKCRNRHVKQNKGCDLKTFEAKYGSKM